jgi:hypothetical protein
MGPISQTELNFGNGNNIIAASPVMLAGLHRTIRTREGKGHNPQYDDFHADTVLYPSPVGQFASNSLNVGNGNNIIYYDSSFKNIIAGTGNNIFIPSFGSFNWSISWIPAYGTQLPQILSEPVLPSPPSIKQGWPGTNDLNQDWLLNSESGLPLISPIPWDQQDGDILNPNRASKIPGKKTIKGSYTDDNSKFAADPQWGKTANLYTINTYLRDPLQKTYFNWQQLNDKDESTVKKSYNPVNKLGNVVLKANGGNNIFYGMDWSFWQHLLPNVGLTTANQPADNAKRVTRAAQHAWYQMTMIGGRGSNTFNLGNVIDNITNNGLFYDGTSSYKISLTHDRIYDSSDEINNQGIAFGNNIDPVTGEPLVSVVNLQLKADPGTVSVTIQNADPGQISSTSEVSAWNSGINAVNKLAGNTLKIQEDFKKAVKAPSWISNSKTLAFIAGRAVPFADTAIAITSAVLGIMSAIAAKPAKPPKQKIEATYAVQGLDTSQKAVLINDWHPGTKINLNLPQVDANEWGNITLSINPPSATSATDNTSHGVYLNVKTTDSLTRIKDDFPLVVLENVGKTEPFGYWSYSFVDPDGMGPLQAGYNQLGPNNLKLFGILPDPSKLLSDDGTTPLNPTTFPVNYQYKSDNGFDMEYDAQNYASRKQTTGTPYYSRYYFDQNISPSNVPAPNWSTKSNLWQYTSNVSFEFDSRSLGWYWQPVMKLDPNNIQNTINPESQTIDFDQSKLWIRNRKDGSWTSSSYADIMYLTRAFIDSQKATTFYYSSKNDEGAKEISRRQAKIDQLEQLATVLPDLRSLDQSLITDERNRLYTLSQVETVKPVQSFQAEGSQRSGLMVRFTSVDTLDKAMPVDLMLYDNDGRIKATVVDGGPPNNSGLPWLGSDPLSGANPSSLLI